MLYQKSVKSFGAITLENGLKITDITKQPPHCVSSLPITTKDFTLLYNSDTSSIIEKLEKYGVCIVRNLIQEEKCDKIVEELDPYFFRDEAWNGSPFPKETTVVTRSILKSPTSADFILCNDLFVQLSSRFLSESNYFWTGNQIREGNSYIQLNSAITYKVGPNAKDQMYHREDMIHHNIHEENDTYKYGSETLLGLSIALTDTTKTNGATRVIPGSHLWGPNRCPDNNEGNACYLELEKGDCAFMLGSTYHAASSNTTSEDRITSFYFMTKSYLKQEENYFLDKNVSYFKKYSNKALKLLGLDLSEPFCGHMDYMNPILLFTAKPNFGKSNPKFQNKNYTETIYPSFT